MLTPSFAGVTDFATGVPVSGVDVSVYLGSYAPDMPLGKSLAVAVTNENGIAWLPGTKTLDPKLDHAYVYGDYQKSSRFFVRCEKDDEVALLPLDYDFRLSMSKFPFYTDMRQKLGHIKTWGTTAQGIYKVGDTVQYKLFVRDQSNKSFVPAPREGYSLKVIDPMGKVAHEIKDLKLSEFGAFDGEFVLSKNAPIGWYDFRLKRDRTWYPLRVLVSDFTPSPFRVRTDLSGKLFYAGDEVTINTSANLHAGGPYVDAPTRVQAVLKQKGLYPSHPLAQGFDFDVHVKGVRDETVFRLDGEKIDDRGELESSFKLSESSQVLYGQLIIESSVRDDRGKDIADSRSARYVGRDRFIGLKETNWLLTAGEQSDILLLVVDEQSNPIAGTDITVDIERRITKASRVKSAGNAYLTHYTHEWQKVGECKTVSELTISHCQFVPASAGIYNFTAKIQDTKGRSHSTALRQWAVGEDFVMWEMPTGNGLEIVPEQTGYKVGDIARYLVKNPFPGAKALITVERLGVLKSWVQTLDSSIALIEFPIEPDFVPGFYLSVTVMSPRVDKPMGANNVDLGKPAFRMGYLKTLVRDPYKDILVNIKTDKEVYGPRDEVTIDLLAKLRHGESGEGIELAMTVLDESVFDLLTGGRASFDPYEGFYRLDDLDMANFSLLMRLVGRQKFEKKGASPGGDGGGSTALSLRSLFRYVSYWNPSIRTDDAGRARVQFTVPDNLTGWRVLVMAVTRGDRMGLGDANFKVNQPIEIRLMLKAGIF